MNLLMCSGNSPRNREWIFEAEERLGGGFERTYVQDYQHWHTGQENIDLEHELPILAEAAQELGDYGVFAKSIGTVLIAQAIEQKRIQPKFLVLCGIPLGYILESYPQFADVLAEANIPLSVVHNDQDKVGTSDEVLEYFGKKLAGLANYRFNEVHAVGHDYDDYVLLGNELDRLSQGAAPATAA